MFVRQTAGSIESTNRVHQNVGGLAPPKKNRVEEVDWIADLRTHLHKPCSVQSIAIDSNGEAAKTCAMELDQRINGGPNAFQRWVPSCQHLCHQLTVRDHDLIRIDYLYQDDLDSNRAIIHAAEKAICWFAANVDYSYNDLSILVALNHHPRALDQTGRNLEERIARSRAGSGAFSASGVTNSSVKMIMVTKKDELVRLLLHELVHYTGLDQELRSQPIQLPWSTGREAYDLSEAYAEAVSVVLMAAHYSDSYGLSMTSILELEIEHNLGLMADILSYAGVEPHRVINWFQGEGPIVRSPIAIWEYVFLRYAFLGKMRFILQQAPDLRVTPQLAKELREITFLDRDTIQLLPKLMANRGYPRKLPYTTTDLAYPIPQDQLQPQFARASDSPASSTPLPGRERKQIVL